MNKILLTLLLIFINCLMAKTIFGQPNVEHIKDGLKGSVHTIIITEEEPSELGELRKIYDQIIEFDIEGALLSNNIIYYEPRSRVCKFWLPEKKSKGIKEIRLSNGKEFPKTICEFNDDGLNIDYKSYDENGSIQTERITIYEYDAFGNWITRVTIKSISDFQEINKEISRTYRVIEYYATK